MLGFNAAASDPVQEPVVQQQNVIDDYIASLGQPTTTQNNDRSQTISGRTNDPSDDITVTNLPKPVYRPTMADVAGPAQPSPQSPQSTFDTMKTPSYYANYNPSSGFGFKDGGLVSVSRYLKGR